MCKELLGEIVEGSGRNARLRCASAEMGDGFEVVCELCYVAVVIVSELAREDCMESARFCG